MRGWLMVLVASAAVVSGAAPSVDLRNDLAEPVSSNLIVAVDGWLRLHRVPVVVEGGGLVVTLCDGGAGRGVAHPHDLDTNRVPATSARVYVGALREPGLAEDDPRFLRRVQRESLRAACLLLGLPPCPFFRCAMFEHSDVQELDSKATNLCPPCHVRFEKIVPVEE